MFLHKKLAPQRDHEQDAQPPAQQCENEDAGVLEVEAEKDQRRQRKNNARGNRLPGVAGGLHDVVFKDGRAAQRPQHRDRQHRDGDGRGDGKPGPQPDVDRDRAEEQPEKRAQQQSAGGELRLLLLRRRHKRLNGVCVGARGQGRRLRFGHGMQRLRLGETA